MRVHGAVLAGVCDDRPYQVSRPLALTELLLEEPHAEELLVKITAAGLCHSDLSVINGDRARPVPMLLGHEAAATVVATGAEITDVHVGDHVTLVYVPACGQCGFCRSAQPAMCERGAAANSNGELLSGGRRISFPDGRPVHHHLGVSAFADHAVVHRSSAVVVDRDIPPAVAALLGCAMATGYGAIARTAGVHAGGSVGVFGLGGVGLAAVMSARALGADPIIAVDPVAQKRRLAIELGANQAVAPQDAASAFAALPTGGAQWTVEAVGSAEVLAAAFTAAGRGGTTVAAGLAHPSAQLRVPALPIVAEARTLRGSYMGSTNPQVDIPAMARLWRDGKLPVERLITGQLTFDDINRGMESLAAGEAVRQILYPTGG